MKIRPDLLPCTIALAALLSASMPAAAQAQAPSATTVASWVQTFYDQTRTMSARFTQRYQNRVYQRTTVSEGQVRFKKPGMMRFDYQDGKIISNDGSRLTVYEPPDTGAGPGQYYQQAISEAQLPAVFSFLTGTGQLAPNYTFRLLRVPFDHGQVLELRPRRPTPHYTRILLYVDDGSRNAALRGVVHRVVIIDQANNQNRFDFADQRYNATIADTAFRYQPPRGARRVQP